MAEVMVFKLIMAAQKQWLRFNGKNQLPKIIQGIKVTNGIEEEMTNQAGAWIEGRHQDSDIARGKNH
jgi:hypothetical protein